MKAQLTILLLILCNLTAVSQTVSTQLTYINVSKPNGGPVSPNDILEIRAVITVRTGTLNNVQFFGVVPAGTTYIPGSMAARSNEGLSSWPGVSTIGTYSDAFDGDKGTLSGSTIYINLGDGATATVGGSIQAGITYPSHWGQLTIIQACYRVRITSPVFTQLNIAGHYFIYGSGAGTRNDLNTILVRVGYNSSCSSFGTTNFITDEFGGTFGSGTATNRAAGSTIVSGFTRANIGSNTPNDGFYAIVRNSSHTNYTGSTPSSSDRVFSVWEIYGDHTGTTTSAGNPPAASGANRGYMLMVNGTYTPGLVFSSTISGLIPGNVYTMRFWVRNLCGSCSGSPTGGAGVGAGVLPNMTLYIGGVDVYNTGNIQAGVGWVEKIFTFQATAATTSVNLRNNAPGGSGNDWTIDDFTINECLILLSSAPMNFKATFINENAVQLKWSGGVEDQLLQYEVESSTDGKDFTTIGTVLPKGNKSNYQYVDSRPVDSKVYYRIKSINKNGEYDYSTTEIIRNTGNQAASMQISPNPSVGLPTVKFWNARAQQVQVEVTDISGRKLYNKSLKGIKGENQVIMDNSLSVKTGMYFVRVMFEDGTSLSEKLIISSK
ncbi:MAG: T9SS C-terminal target domain-containing protein [Sphingobacteriales bacterium]|nr:MAG: T9SS C-terminal target domain-containing protein [Sphingobacteriales bacterium]